MTGMRKWSSPFGFGRKNAITHWKSEKKELHEVKMGQLWHEQAAHWSSGSEIDVYVLNLPSAAD